MIQDIYPHRLWNQYRPEAEAEQDSVVLYFTAEGVLNRLQTADPHSLPEAERIHAGDGQGMAGPTRLDSASAAEDNAIDPDAGDKLQLLEFPVSGISREPVFWTMRSSFTSSLWMRRSIFCCGNGS